MPSDTVSKIIQNYEKISKDKLIQRYHRYIEPLNDKLSHNDYTIFEHELYIIPELDVSLFWNNLPQDKRKRIWDTLRRLQICSRIIVSSQNDEKNKSDEKEVKKEVVIEKSKDEFDLFKGVGSDGEKISMDTMEEEIDAGKVDGNPIMRMIKDKMNPDEISKQLQNVDKKQIQQMTKEVQQIISPHVNDPEVSGMLGDLIGDIGTELQQTDLSKGDLFENIMGIASKISTKMEKDKNINKCSPDKLLAPMQSLMKQIGLPSDLNITDPNILGSLLGQIGGNQSQQMQSILKMAQNKMGKK